MLCVGSSLRANRGAWVAPSGRCRLASFVQKTVSEETSVTGVEEQVLSIPMGVEEQVLPQSHTPFYVRTT